MKDLKLLERFNVRLLREKDNNKTICGSCYLLRASTQSREISFPKKVIPFGICVHVHWKEFGKYVGEHEE